MVKKAYPEERVGVYAQQGNGVAVVEYRHVTQMPMHSMYDSPGDRCRTHAPSHAVRGLQPDACQ